MTDLNNHDHEEIEQLLPWYEKGTLSAAEMQRVEAYLAAHPELRSRLTLIREEVAETVAANESLGMPSPAVRDRLMEQIASEAGNSSETSSGFKSWISGFLPSGLSPALAIAGAAAVVIIAVQAAVLVSVLSDKSRDGGYRVATGGQTQQLATGSLVLVRFANGAKADDITGLLRSIKGAVVDGPLPGGTFKIRISRKPLPAEERDTILQKLRERADVVAFVAPTQ